MMHELSRWAAVRFDQPLWLWLLAIPVVLLGLWVWRLAQRGRDRRAYRRRIGTRRLPIFGDLLGWLCLVLALAAVIAALARPVMVTSTVRTAGVDIVVLLDGSASMRVQDVRSTRWGRAMQFLRAVGQSLRWEEDRIALALFASIATPQIRLTRDPNTFFFFLDNLEDEPPFRLQDIGTWDTNIERGIYWGLRLVNKDEELLGPSKNGRAFLLVSDGQAWSGEVQQSLDLARERHIPVYVVGVGTTAGGIIPEPQRAADDRPVASQLDRNSLATIATEGGGRYFELDRESDTEIANAIIAATRRQAIQRGVKEGTEPLHQQMMWVAAALVVLSAAAKVL